MRRTRASGRNPADDPESGGGAFLEKGYENVSLDESPARRPSRGAVHWHFRNKQGLLFAIRDEMRLPMQDQRSG